MQNRDSHLVFSPSDLNNFLECAHLTALDVQRCREGLSVEELPSPETNLLRRLGLEHERAWRERFLAEERELVDIDPPGVSLEGWTAGAERTIAAMRRGADVVYQAVFTAGDWRGIADFVVRIEDVTDLGPWGYEAWDTKLGRHARPTYALQLAFYTEQVARLQGRQPDWMRVVLGTNDVQPLRTDDYLSYYRSVRRRFRRFAAAPPTTYPYPVPHCAACRYRQQCDQRWRADDHVSLVAGIRRETALRLEMSGVATMAALAGCEAPIDRRVSETAFRSLREQARLQRTFIDTGHHSYTLVPPAEERGFALMPAPSQGDLFFDMEGYPYFDLSGGLEYLFGVAWTEGRSDQFRAWWATDRDAEKAAFESLIDFIRERLRLDPNLHVYHYASYERSKLGQLAQRLATREEELDDLLRRQVFVDLYKVVRQSLRTSHEGYSLKDIRRFFMDDVGGGDVATAGESIIEFDRWLATKDSAILDAIEKYNEEDCLSTLRLRDWLVVRKTEAEAQFGSAIAWRPSPEAAAKAIEDPNDENAELRTSLLRARDDPDETAALRLVASLLDYHRREDKPEWWAYFDRIESSTQELQEDAEALVGLEPAGSPTPPVGRARSWIYPLAFPPQEYKFDVGSNVEDLRTGKGAGDIVAFDHDGRVLGLKRGGKPEVQILPRVIVAGKPFLSNEQRGAVLRVAEHFDRLGLHAERYRAIADLLLRHPPRFRGRAVGESVQTLDLREQQVLVSDLDESTLVIQGPPGSGKTWTAARLIVPLLEAGARVGVAAFSHRAIHNLLRDVEQFAAERGFSFRGLKKATAGRVDSRYDGRFIASTEDNEDCADRSVRLIAGTSYLFSRAQIEESGVDYLFVDEAGQLSLGDAVAMGVAARNLVLLGDPQQLPQVAHGVHPHGADASVLQHYLGGDATVPPDRGLFLARTYRMHPDLCAFVSRLAYDGRLEADASCAIQGIVSSGQSGTGIRYLPVEHRGNAQLSIEEADLIAREVEALLTTGEFTDRSGRTRRVGPADILVVAPYNMQVRCLRERLPTGVDVGTVDKFQGREAAVVFFSMATSSAADLPRNMEFLLSRNRLNVAMSRARCLSILVASPRLLDVPCGSLEQMALVNGLCRFVEVATQGTSERG